MRLRIKVYDFNGQVHNRLDLSVGDETNIPEVLDDIEGFLIEQYFELTDEEADE